MSKCITIYTDASFCLQTRCAAWACWVKYGEGQKIQYSAPFKKAPKNATDAEYKAAMNALTLVIRNLKPNNQIFVLVTDNEDVVWRFKGGKTRPDRAKKTEYLAEYSDKIKNLIPDTCTLRVNKVKAHSNADGKRSYVNDVVDRMAKAHMLQMRKGKKHRPEGYFS